MKPTQTELDDYEMELANFNARIARKRELLEAILKYANEYGIDNTRRYFTNEIDKESGMDAPNPPGYYRANND